MAKAFTHFVDLDSETRVPYSAKPRANRGKWSVVFNDAAGNRVQLATPHEIRGKTAPDALHDDAKRLIRDYLRPPTLFPVVTRKTWDELLTEVETTSPNTRSETLRSFRAGVKAFREVIPEVASPLDISEDRVRRFSKLWLAAPSKKGKGGGKRSPTTLSYYLRGLSAFTNHLIALGYMSQNLWCGVKAPKGDRTKKPTPTETDTTHFFDWVHARYPEWVSLHAILDLKAISASRTADVCQLKTLQLRDGGITFDAGIVKTATSRTIPLPDELFRTLKKVAGKIHLWDGLFRDIPKYRKSSNGYPAEFSWKTVYYVLNNLFREYNKAHPDHKFSPHALRRRAITLMVKATGSVEMTGQVLGVTAQTARTYYLDDKQAFDTTETMRRLAETLRPKTSEIKGPKRDQTDSGTKKDAEN